MGSAGSEDGSLEFTEILLGASTEVNERLRAGAQLISREYGDTGGF